MQPTQPQGSLDYLNQIAPQEKRDLRNDKMFFGIIGVGLVLAIVVGLMVLNSGPNLTTDLENLSAQLTTLQKITSSANTTIHDNQLQGINANLTLQLTNANQALTAPLKSVGINPSAIPQTIVAKNADTDLVNKLKDAQLNAVFDRVYSTNMSYEIQAVLIQMRGIEKQTNNSSLKSFIDSTRNNLQPLQTQMQSFADQSS